MRSRIKSAAMICILWMGVLCPKTAAAEIHEPQDLYAQAAVVMEAETGRILYEKNGNEQRAMASTTKLMTLVIALEYGDFDQPVTVSARAAAQPKVNMNMRQGETFRLGDLLYAMMLQSYNDVALAIAEAVGGSVEEFCWLMNMKAVELGARQTHFATPNGLDHEDHYSTAVDMALIARYVLKNEEALKIMQTASYTIDKDEINSRTVSLINKNPLLTSYAGTVGGKTGFTAKAGLCLVGMAQRDGITLITVVLGAGWPPNSSYRVRDCQKLFEYGFTNYYFAGIPVKEKDTFEPIEVRNGLQEQVSTHIEGDISYFMRADDTWDLQYNLPYVMDAPIQKGQVMGTVSVCINGQAIGYLDVVADEDVSCRTFLYYLRRLIRVGTEDIWSVYKSLWPTAAQDPAGNVRSGLQPGW